MKCSLMLMAVLAATLIQFPMFAQGNKEKCPDMLENIEKSGDFAPLFPFQPTHEAPQNITNVASWPGYDPNQAGTTGFISAEGEDFVDALGNHKRFWGTNICFDGCFPEHEDAERVAEELTRYGINVVRLHYVHHKFPADKIYPKPNSFIEPKQLERFDYLFAKLKEKGIYTYFQLNIARKFGEHNGFENADKLPFYNHGVDNVVEAMITLQERFHYEILNHKNPYTGLCYKDDPAIAMLELANENSIMHAWFAPRYRFPDLVEPYASYIKSLWNSWLLAKYGSTESLKKAWLSGLEGNGTEYAPDGIINTDRPKGWNLQVDKMTEAQWSVVPATTKDKIKGSHYLRLKIEKTGASSNMPQFSKKGFRVKSMEPLCLKVKMRADSPVEARVRLSQAHAPWSSAGLNTTVSLTRKWKEYEFNFTSNMKDDNVRIMFSNLPQCVVDIADVSLRSGIEYDWPKEQSLEDCNIDWPYSNEWFLLPNRALDFTEFLAQQESYYFSHLHNHLKMKVKALQPVAGTQRFYGFDLPQVKMDFVDHHKYWQHPVFPGGKVFEGSWNIGAAPQVNGERFPSTVLSGLAGTRIWGKPMTISEYDCPNMNPYSAEANLLASAFGAFQNWAGIMQFSWINGDDFSRDFMPPLFGMCSSTHKLVHLPACYAMYVRGDVKKGDTDIVYSSSSSFEKDMKAVAMSRSVRPKSASSQLLGSLPLAVVAGMEIEDMQGLFEAENKTVIRTEDDIPSHIKAAFDSKEVKSSTGELTWNWQVKDAGYFKVDTKYTKVFTGFVDNRVFDYEGMALAPGNNRLDWLTFSMTLTNPDGMETSEGVIVPGKYLVALTGLCHNTDAVYATLGGGKKISCSASYGGLTGKAPILCEGINAVLTLQSLAGRVECYALDGGGNRMMQVPVSEDGKGNATVSFGPQYKTVWYEMTIR